MSNMKTQYVVSRPYKIDEHGNEVENENGVYTLWICEDKDEAQMATMVVDGLQRSCTPEQWRVLWKSYAAIANNSSNNKEAVTRDKWAWFELIYKMLYNDLGPKIENTKAAIKDKL